MALAFLHCDQYKHSGKHPGLLDSIQQFSLFASKDPETPLQDISLDLSSFSPSPPKYAYDLPIKTPFQANYYHPKPEKLIKNKSLYLEANQDGVQNLTDVFLTPPPFCFLCEKFISLSWLGTWPSHL
jgi:hypothetical protein